MSYLVDSSKIAAKDRFFVNNIEAVQRACVVLGLVFTKGGDYHIYNDRDPRKPKADYTIKLSDDQRKTVQLKMFNREVRDRHLQPYDIGLIRSEKDNGWYLVSDNDPNMPGSRMLAEICGPVVYPGGNNRYSGEPLYGFGLLMQRYFIEAAKLQAEKLGHSVTEMITENGEISLVAEVPEEKVNLANAYV